MFPLVVFLSASAPLIDKTPCPVLQPVKNFNLTAYASGVWYEIARYPDDFEDGDCVIAKFNTDNEVKKFRLSDVTDHHYVNFDGYALSDARNNGALIFRSASFTASQGEPEFPVYMLAIDYDSYYIAFKCKYDAATKTRKDYAWVGSRTKTLDPIAKAQVDDFLKTADDNEHPIDVNNLIWIHFTDDACMVV